MRVQAYLRTHFCSFSNINQCIFERAILFKDLVLPLSFVKCINILISHNFIVLNFRADVNI